MVFFAPMQQIQVPTGVVEFIQVKRAGKTKTKTRMKLFYGLKSPLVKNIKILGIVKTVQSWRCIGQMPDTEFPLQYFLHAVAGNDMFHKGGNQIAPQIKSLWLAYKMPEGKTVRLLCQGGRHVAELQKWFQADAP